MTRAQTEDIVIQRHRLRKTRTLIASVALGLGLSACSASPEEMEPEATEPGSDITGEYLFHQEIDRRVNDLVHDTDAQNQLLAAYAEDTGVTLS